MRISVEEACLRLLSGETVAVPTETVYGLAAPVHMARSVEQIFALKKRPSHNPLIIHLADSDALEEYGTSFPEATEELIEAFWPGPLTLVLPVDPERVPAIVRAELPTAAFRMPNQAHTRDIIRKVGPIAAPSANLSGYPSATHPEHVEADFGVDFPVVDAGPCPGGLESTILTFHEGEWRVARLGALPAPAFAPLLGYTPSLIPASLPLLCPGQCEKHYAPKSSLVGGETYPGTPKAVVGFTDRSYPGAECFPLGPSDDPEIVSHNLYQVLRSLDEKGVAAAWVDLNFPQEGLWCTIAERLRRAAKSELRTLS